LTGDHLSGTEAAAWGLAYRALPAETFDVALDELTERLAAKSPEALAGIKALVRRGLERPLAEGLAREREAVLEHLQHSSAGAGIEKFASREAEGTP
jgi:enoyl-CoA hydratase